LSLFDRGTVFDDEIDVNEPQSVEVQLSTGKTLGDTRPLQVAVQCLRLFYGHLQKRGIVVFSLGSSHEPIKENQRQRLKTFSSVLGPLGFKV